MSYLCDYVSLLARKGKKTTNMHRLSTNRGSFFLSSRRTVGTVFNFEEEGVCVCVRASKQTPSCFASSKQQTDGMRKLTDGRPVQSLNQLGTFLAGGHLNLCR